MNNVGIKRGRGFLQETRTIKKAIHKKQRGNVLLQENKKRKGNIIFIAMQRSVVKHVKTIVLKLYRLCLEELKSMPCEIAKLSK